MRKSLLAASSAAVLLFAGGAWADGGPMPEPEPEPVYEEPAPEPEPQPEPEPVYEPAGPEFSWTGFYAGIQVGWQWDNDSDVPWGDPVGAPLIFNDGPLVYDSFVGGGHLGFNFQTGWLVFGAEGDIEWVPGEGDDEDRGGHVNGIDTNFQFSLRGRVGAAFGHSLIYATGGYSYLDADAVVRDVGGQPDISTSFDGWTLGGGWECSLGSSWSLRAEYRYTDYGLQAEDYLITDYTLGFEPEIHSVRVGASWYF